jgi:hypothetical protein
MKTKSFDCLRSFQFTLEELLATSSDTVGKNYSNSSVHTQTIFMRDFNRYVRLKNT